MFMYLPACKREKNDFIPVSELFISVINDLKLPVNGAVIAVFNTEIDYDEASVTRSFSKAILVVTTANSSRGSGQAQIQLQPNTSYFILITYYDPARSYNMSNLGLSGKINPLPIRSSAFIDFRIGPDDGNIIFYSTATNKVPIDITIANSFNHAQKAFSLTTLYTSSGIPTASSAGIIRVPRDPGKYTYYAKNSDGCAWSGFVTLNKGEDVSIDLGQCKSSSISFYTPTVSDTLLPLTVVLNTIDTAGQITAKRASLICTDDRSNTLSFIRNEGLYNYQVKSATGRCIWTGSFKARTGDCIIIPINNNVCE